MKKTKANKAVPRYSPVELLLCELSLEQDLKNIKKRTKK